MTYQCRVWCGHGRSSGFHVEPVVWLVTTTDAERDAVIHGGIPREVVIERLRQAGVRDDLAARAGVEVESQETIGRGLRHSYSGRR